MIRKKLQQFLTAAIFAEWSREVLGDLPVEVTVVEREAFGDYASNVAFVVGKKLGLTPLAVAEKLLPRLIAQKLSEVEKIEAAAPGFINFYLSPAFLQQQVGLIANDDRYGLGESLKGQTIMVEFTDPNPFKLFHIGHLMSNAIGESIARLYESNGAKVIRANYQGDVGLHVAKTIFGIVSFPGSKNGEEYIPSEEDSLAKKMEFLGQVYTKGSAASESFKTEIENINKKVYDRSDDKINRIYDLGKKWSLDYFEEIYKKLGMRLSAMNQGKIFDHYFFESETGKDGLEIVKHNKDVFVESEGAVVFKGEDHGLHTRVFINSQGLPTYEAKELGLNKKKFELYPELDLSVVITGNEIIDYFKVLLKAMELVLPEVAAKTRHVPHGMLRLPSGKMSSRTGEVITAEWLIDQTKQKVLAKMQDPGVQLGPTLTEHRDSVAEAIAIGAIKYSILKQSPGKDIIFDFDKSLSIEGDSGPYVQYAYARLKSILLAFGHQEAATPDFSQLTHPAELGLIKLLLQFPELVRDSGATLSPHHLVLYVYKLAAGINNFYEKVRVLNDDNRQRMAARLVLIEAVASILARGLDILGIKALTRI